MTLFLELRFFAVRCLVGGAVVVAIAGVITLTPSSPDAAGRGLFPRGTRQCQPAWLANFLGSALQGLPFGAAIPHAPRSPPVVFAPALAAGAGGFPLFLLTRAPR